MEELQSSLEAHELMVLGKGTKIENQQALHEQVLQKDGVEKNLKKKSKGGSKV